MNDSNPYDVTQDQQGNPISPDDTAPAPPLKQIGRYRIEKVLGKGGFGLVYLAHDEQLDRLVAIKVPHAKLISKPEDAEAYLTEARTVANLDHPGIVPVHDVGSTEECPCYVVSKYIEGNDLSTKLKQQRLKYRDAAELVATVAEALHYAHKQGLVHRDVKPGNILIGKDSQPFVVDFGLALREENVGKGPQYAGTPAYMSPEQARGEGHRVDGRSDIFSLGVVFYELLVGRRPFRGDTQPELLEQITSYDPKPPRQIHDRIPKELERICQKAMAKRASERYSTAKDLAEDLHLYLKEQALIQTGMSPGGATPVAEETIGTRGMSTAADSGAVTDGESSDSQPIKIVPKGLRSFDAHDADFFLELLPGPRDRNGLPDSLRFWKTRIEETDPDNTFSVGLIYGPSGCGKSSMVKAGLLPRLSEDVIPVYIEATPEETETRLLYGLRKRCLALEDNLNLKDTLAALRRGQGIPVGKKVLIVLDQFEQWLHANKEEENTDLVQALRQCDGGRVQCIVMVRDDFWMAATRFMRELEIRLLEGQNSAAVDLFPVRHAEKVLAAFGRAFGTLADSISGTAKEQKDFLKQSVAGLAEEGKVICVRLALFAEMMKSKEWTPATLKEVGGTAGVGVTFLEETFSASTSPPEHRYHQKAARAILKDLLPDSGTDIKGYMRSHAELLEASGYGSRPKDFNDLIRILDSEIRLITPTDPEGKDADDESVTQTQAGQKYFQLTHDYLVHSLRDWLTRKQKETRKGRAELKLFDTSVTWNAKPENRFLPSWWEHLNIRLLTDKQKWTEPQRKMMGKAGRVHGIRTGTIALLLMACSFIGLNIRNSINESQNLTRAEALVDSLASADIAQVPAVTSDLKAYREWADPLLKTRISEAADGSAEKLQLALALLPVDHSQIEYLRDQLTVCSLTQFPVVRTAMLPHKGKLVETLWKVAIDEEQNNATRFQAAAALAEYAPDDQHWQATAPFVAQHLTAAVSPVHLGHWRDLLQPANEQLAGPLIAIHADRALSEKQREAAAFILSEYLGNQPDKLVDVILLADEFAEFTLLSNALKPHAAATQQRLLAQMQAAMSAELDKTNAQLSDEDEQRRDAHWQRQALAAVALVHLGYADEVWPVLEFTPNPSLRSFIIHYLGKLGTDHNTLAARLKLEEEVSIRRALIQSLGGLDVSQIAVSDRERIAEQLKSMYLNDPDSGIHSSASWTLRQWGVSLAELPVREPILSGEQKQRITRLTEQVNNLREQIAAAKMELPIRQARWEQSLEKQGHSEPESLKDGLVTHYPLDEEEGQIVSNAILGQGNASLDTLHEPTWVPGVLGTGIQFDGRGGHLVIGGERPLKHNDAMTFTCWFKTSVRNGRAYLLSTLDSESRRGIGISLNLDANAIMCEWQHAYPENWACVLGAIPKILGEWHHLAVTYDGSSSPKGFRIYLNGQSVPLEVTANTLAGTTLTQVPLWIGGRDSGYFYNGSLDDWRLYNRPLTDEEIQYTYNKTIREIKAIPKGERTTDQERLLRDLSETGSEFANVKKSDFDSVEEGLLFHYNFDEGKGKTAANAVTKGPDATFPRENLSKWVSGIVGNALDLAGESPIIGGEPLNFESDKPFSIACWLYSTGKPGVLLSTSKTENEFHGFEVGISREKLLVTIAGKPADIKVGNKNTNRLIAVSATDIPKDQWHHLVVSYDGTERSNGVNCFIDGNSVEMTTLSDTLSDTIKSNTPLFVGARQGRFPLRCRIDDLRVYRRVLRGQEVENLFEMGVKSLVSIPIEKRDTAQQQLLTKRYENFDEPLLHLWGELAAIETSLNNARWDATRRWYINKQGQTMLVIPNLVRDAKAPDSFAIASHEVTLAEFRRFRDSHKIHSYIAPTESCPVHDVRWYDAAAYCNWLSEQEGIKEDQWVYQPNENGRYDDGMKIKVNATQLTGYRLPTESEWKYACAAGSKTSYSFGEPIPLLANHGWYVANSLTQCHPAGSLLPNENGFFDMHGNTGEMLHGLGNSSDLVANPTKGHSAAGGSYTSHSFDAESKSKFYTRIGGAFTYIGFRVARTHRHERE